MPCEVHDVEVAAIRPAIDGVMRRRFGSVEVDVTDDGTALVGTIVPMAVDPVRLQLEHSPDDPVTVEVLAPFPVRVDRKTNTVLPDVIVVPVDTWPFIAGLRVREGAQDAVIVAIDGTRATLRDPACTPEPPSPAPAPTVGGASIGWTVLAVSWAAVAGVLVWRRGRRA